VNALLLSAVCVSIRPSVTKVIHDQTAKHIEMYFEPKIERAFLAVAKLLVRNSARLIVVFQYRKLIH